jgi:hypothetical protein
MSGFADFLRRFIWSRVSGLMLFRDGANKGTISNVQISKKKKVRQRPWQ